MTSNCTSTVIASTASLCWSAFAPLNEGADPAAFGKMIQYVFQDPISSLNPRKSIRQIMEAPLKQLHSMAKPERGSPEFRAARTSHTFRITNWYDINIHMGI